MNATEILNKARHILERDGWYQGGYSSAEADHEDDGGYSVCTIGAINRAATGNCWRSIVGPARMEAYERIWRVNGHRPVAHWNDDPDTTEEDVLLALKHAATIDL